MATRKQIDEATAAADTLKPGSKSEMMSTLVGKMTNMNKEDLTSLFTRTLEQIGHEADSIPGDAASKNAASIAGKAAVKEDIGALFDDEALSEDFKNRASTIFEAAVELRVQSRIAEIEEAVEAYTTDRVDDAIAEVTEALVEQVDNYVSYVAEQWINENSVAIDSSIRSELTEEFIGDLRNLFLEHNIAIPDSETDVLEEMVETIDELKARLDETINHNLMLEGAIEDATKAALVDEISEGLTISQREQLVALSESIDFDDADQFEEKLLVIKEGLVDKKFTRSTGVINEDASFENSDDIKKAVDPTMERYAEAISKSLR